MPRGILAYDIATKLGWAFSEDAAARPHFGAFRLQGKDLGEAGAEFADLVADQITLMDPARICFEAPLVHGQGQQRARKLLGFCFMLEVIGYRRDVPCFEVANSTVKLHYAGHGHADKEMMIAAASKRGHDVGGISDIADALGVLDYSWCQFDPEGWRRANLPADLLNQAVA